MTAPEGVYISPAQTYAEVQQLVKGMGRLEEKVDRFLDEVKDVRLDVADHESRIRSLEHGNTEAQKRDAARVSALERRVWTASGAVGALCMAGGYLLQYVNG
jgi:hypothetical protein